MSVPATRRSPIESTSSPASHARALPVAPPHRMRWRRRCTAEPIRFTEGITGTNVLAIYLTLIAGFALIAHAKITQAW